MFNQKLQTKKYIILVILGLGLVYYSSIERLVSGQSFTKTKF